MGLLLVVNLHGSINSAGPVRTAMEELKVWKRFTATVLTDDPATLGMLRLCKDRLAWTAVDSETLAMLLKKKGMVSTSKSLDAAALKKLGFKKHDDLAEKMVKEDLRLSAVEGLRPFFRLAPPRGGFKRSMRRQFGEKGSLGKNPDLLKIVERMV